MCGTGTLQVSQTTESTSGKTIKTVTCEKCTYRTEQVVDTAGRKLFQG
jgi:C4-type Zn-finger protein